MMLMIPACETSLHSYRPILRSDEQWVATAFKARSVTAYLHDARSKFCSSVKRGEVFTRTPSVT